MSYFGYDWYLYVFKLNTGSKYLVPIEIGEEDQAWKDLANRLSISVERTKQCCKLVAVLNGNSKILKL